MGVDIVFSSLGSKDRKSKAGSATCKRAKAAPDVDGLRRRFRSRYPATEPNHAHSPCFYFCLTTSWLCWVDSQKYPSLAFVCSKRWYSELWGVRTSLQSRAAYPDLRLFAADSTRAFVQSLATVEQIASIRTGCQAFKGSSGTAGCSGWLRHLSIYPAFF